MFIPSAATLECRLVYRFAFFPRFCSGAYSMKKNSRIFQLSEVRQVTNFLCLFTFSDLVPSPMVTFSSQYLWTIVANDSG